MAVLEKKLETYEKKNKLEGSCVYSPVWFLF